jgi:hypothetical protein
MASHEDRLLQLIYRLSHGDADQIIGRKNLGQPLGLSPKETKKALKALTKASYIRPIIFNSLAITAVGIAHVELNLQSTPDTSIEDLQQLIHRKQRRLQKLKEAQAVKGPNTDPEILIEIEDLEADLYELQEQLRGIKEDDP